MLLFGHVGGPEASQTLTIEHSHLTLTRRACIHSAHRHAASYLISRVVKLAGVDVVSAYADPAAGETGSVSQACGWIYVGQGLGRDRNALRPRLEQWQTPNDRIGRFCTRSAAPGADSGGFPGAALDRRLQPPYPKHRCAWIRNKRQRELLRWPALPYPKR